MKRQWKAVMIPLMAALIILVSAVTVQAGSYAWQSKGTSTTATVGWVDYSNEYSDVTEYWVTWGTSYDSQTRQSPVLSKNARSYKITGLTPNTSYAVRVHYTYVSKTSGNTYSSYYSLLSVCTTPGKVRKFGKAVVDVSSATKRMGLSWTAPTGGTASKRYQYQIFNASGKKLTTNTCYGASLYLSPYKYYNQVTRFRVRGINTIYDKNSEAVQIYGPWSSYKTIIPQPVVSTNTKKYGIHNGKLKLSFKRVKGAKKYVIYVSKKEKSGFKKVATVKQKSSKNIKVTINKFKGASFNVKNTYYLKIITYSKWGKGRGDNYTKYYATYSF